MKAHRSSVGFRSPRSPAPARTIARALEHQRAGRFREAEGIYRRILKSEPNHPDALHLLGVLAHQVGRSDIAADLIAKAIAASPATPDFHAHLGLALEAQGRLDEAVASHRRALALTPDFADAHHNLGLVLRAKGELGDAIASFRRTVALDPDHAEGHTNLGAALEAQGHVDEAVASHQRALALKPELAEAHTNLGLALQAQGRLDEAVASHQRARALKPDLVEAHRNLGLALQTKGELIDAMACFLRAIVLRPDDAEAHTSLGMVLRDLGQLDQAVASYQRALALRPGSPEALTNLGVALHALGRLDEAAASYERALALKPALAEAHNNLGNTLNDLGRLDQAVERYERALALGLDVAETHSNLGTALLNQGRLDEGLASYRRGCALKPQAAFEIAIATALPVIPPSTRAILAARRRMQEDVDRLLASDLGEAGTNRPVSRPAFYLAYHGLDDRELQRKIARLHLAAYPSLDWTAPHCLEQKQRAAGRIRIGFVSLYFHNHSIGKLTRGLIEHLSRDRFEVVVLHGRVKHDEMSAAIDRAADRVVHLPGDLDEARRLIADQALDVLFYPDIGMNSMTYLLAFARLAPVQCVTWGHPVTTGIPNVDYFVSSVGLEPEGAEAHYTERLHRLSRLPAYYHLPPAGDGQPDRRRLGLDPDSTLYVCPQSLFKLHPDFDEVLAEILRRDRRGQLVLIEGLSAHWSRGLRERLAAALGDMSGRVRILPRLSTAEFENLLRVADAVLDPLHFGGGNSTYEATALGVPVVTWPGRFMRGRVTSGCYAQMGVMDCIAGSAEQYVALALRLAGDRDWRHEVSLRIVSNSHHLFEDMAAVNELEEFFERAVTTVPSGRAH